MQDERLIDLVQRSLDGATSEIEEMELTQRMAEVAAARSYFEDMKGVALMLGRASIAAPPPDFTASVMREVRAHVPTAAAAAGHVRVFSSKTPGVRSQESGTSRTEKRRSHALRIGLGVAAAAAIAFFVAPSTFVAPDPGTLRGTMVAPVPAQRSTISVGPKSSIEVTTSRDEVVLRFNVIAGARGVATITFDARALRSAAASLASASSGRLQVDLDATPIVRMQRLTAEAVALDVETRFSEQPPFHTKIEISAAGDERSPSTNFRR